MTFIIDGEDDPIRGPNPEGIIFDDLIQPHVEPRNCYGPEGVIFDDPEVGMFADRLAALAGFIMAAVISAVVVVTVYGWYLVAVRVF